ncbi:hypothetical protein ACIP93_30945 [Streptomyces sp. NPDC088745]|uniref:hypothetical protein n=1 Tax=Streptomyces sp. NPDC088745 TaxID=3365884 RepID=UPI0038129578
MAELGGNTASTLRACISCGNSEVPQPQTAVGGRDQWPRAVAEDWVEARQRSHEGIRATMSAGDRDNLSPGAAEVRDRFAADSLARDVAVSLDRIPPTDVLGPGVEGTVPE